jgi:hypothetical protein
MGQPGHTENSSEVFPESLFPGKQTIPAFITPVEKAHVTEMAFTVSESVVQ